MSNDKPTSQQAKKWLKKSLKKKKNNKKNDINIFLLNLYLGDKRQGHLSLGHDRVRKEGIRIRKQQTRWSLKQTPAQTPGLDWLLVGPHRAGPSFGGVSELSCAHNRPGELWVGAELQGQVRSVNTS